MVNYTVILSFWELSYWAAVFCNIMIKLYIYRLQYLFIDILYSLRREQSEYIYDDMMLAG